MVDTVRRFASLNRLYGETATDRLAGAHVMVVGLGGVGSWAVEALARSAVGRLTLVDMDHVAESNINRQIQATDANLGKSKVDALAERIAQYAPECRVHSVDDFLSEANAGQLLTTFAQSGGGVVLDCCDQTSAKIALVLVAKRLKLKVALAGSAGGKTWPWAVQLADLKES
ncbi:MAG: ThiF family adenylyltransferase, partial [Limnobacter sp.]|nr:ThiF family adenylyltransferase [Limnobacter sp.]